MIQCMHCPQTVLTIEALKIHFSVSHPLVNFDQYQCSNCLSDFKSWAQYRKHLKDFHRFPSKLKDASLGQRKERQCPQQENASFHNSDCEDNCTDTGDFHIPSANCFREDLSSFMLEYLARLYAAPSLPRSHVQLIVDETKVLLNKISSVINPVVVSTLKDHNVDDETVQKVRQILDEVNRPLDSLSSEYHRLRALEKSGCLIHPVPYTIGHSMEDKKTKNGGFAKEVVTMTGQFVPLRKTFKSFFSLPGVYETCKTYMDSLEEESDVLSNFVQGSLWKEKKKNFPNKVVFPLFVYFDDLELNDPLGSHKGVSKIGATYVTIPCLPPEFRSTLDNIFLVLLFYSLDRSRFGNTATFNILVQKINYLQKFGITITIDGHEQQIYFALGLILGDNLGLNSILGFVECFRANYYCRLCRTHRDLTQSDICERPDKIRKIEDFANDLEDTTENTGLKEDSVWNSVDHHHAYKNICSDPLLHEFAEGAGKWGMRHIVHHYVVVEKAFSIEQLNERLKLFDCNMNGISNRPPVITEKEASEKTMKMSGSEMINFVSIFGVLVGDLVPHDRVWEYYLILRQILEIVSAKSVQVECINLLRNLITSHHELYLVLFKETLKPKHHLMLHWPMILSMCGPLSLISTMRFESKNRMFKLRSNATASRRDIVYTTAFKEQLQFCFRLKSQTGLISKFEAGPGHCVTEADDLNALLNCYVDIPIGFRSACVDVPWINKKGTVYKVGMHLALHADEDDLPVFGKITQILYNEAQEVCFLCRGLYTVGFDEHYHAFEVVDSDVNLAKLHEDLMAFLPVIYIHKGNGKRYVTFK